MIGLFKKWKIHYLIIKYCNFYLIIHLFDCQYYQFNSIYDIYPRIDINATKFRMKFKKKTIKNISSVSKYWSYRQFICTVL